MIAYLRGRILSKEPGIVILDVNGVGYSVKIPLSTFYVLGCDNEEISLSIYTHVREDQISLFGFAESNERTAFTKLISISGIGPSLALNILSGCSVSELVSFVNCSNAKSFQAIPGVGKKTAERIILELKGKLKDLDSGHGESTADYSESDGSILNDVLSALINLGYKPGEAEQASREALTENDENVELDGLLKASLRKLSKL